MRLTAANNAGCMTIMYNAPTHPFERLADDWLNWFHPFLRYYVFRINIIFQSTHTNDKIIKCQVFSNKCYWPPSHTLPCKWLNTNPSSLLKWPEVIHKHALIDNMFISAQLIDLLTTIYYIMPTYYIWNGVSNICQNHTHTHTQMNYISDRNFFEPFLLFVMTFFFFHSWRLILHIK